MTHLRRLLLLVPLVLALALASGQGRAQSTATGRFAFADTTLLRDTLNLTFERLFPLADSLQVLPDSLRAWSIRYRYTLDRILVLADSLAMPVDSVGPVLLRERFNPLSAGPRNSSNFTYNSTYSVQQNSNSWVNGADIRVVRGAVFFNNTTNITLNNYTSGGRKSFQETRSAQNEGGWKFSPNLSVGGRANLDRFDNTSQGSQYSEDETKSEYQVSVRTRQQPLRGVTSELNFFGGRLAVDNLSLQKNGLLHDLNGRIRVTRGSWLTHDLQGQINGNFSNSNAPNSPTRVDTRDRSRNLRGSLGLWNSGPASLNVNYNLRDVRVQNPAPAESLARGIPVTEVVTEDRGVDASLRLRRDNDRYINLTQRFGTKEQASSVTATAQNAKDDRGFSASGRYGIRNASLDVVFSITEADSRYPRRNAKGGYDEDLFSRSVSATLAWTLSPKLILKSVGSVNLSSNRYAVIDSFNALPADRDSYRQSYRTEALYNRSDRFNTAVGLEVARILGINLPAASTASNNEVRTYRADWRWSYRLSQGLTATQRNLLSADYTYYRFSSNNRLSLDYTTNTTLNAVLTQRLQLDINHSARFQPSGDLVRDTTDNLDYLQLADETNSYTLDARLSYTPVRGIALNIRPQYVATNRDGTVDGVSEPQRKNRILTFQGGASLDLPLGTRGQLTGDISRSFRADQSTSYTAGNPRVGRVNESDYWVGTLQVRWEL